MFILHSLMIIVPVLVSVAFFTLMERKILGLSQLRKGPNKTSFFGFLQPISDAVKLFLKEMTSPISSALIFYFAPVMALFLSMTLWEISPNTSVPLNFSFSMIILLVVLSMGLYPILIAGWSSNSKFSFIGSLRGVAQTISYEISLAIIILSISLSVYSTELIKWSETSFVSSVFICSPVVMLWLISCVAETNRTPFDFAEGESELVSGFNTEYGAVGFALIFMAEYASILFLSFLTSNVLLNEMSPLTLTISTVIFAFFWVWIRSTFPRFRYDKLMSMAWKKILPSSLALLFLASSLMMI